MNPLIQGHSGTTPDISRNAYGTNQGTIEDDFQSNPHPEAGIFQSQATRNSGPEDGHDTHLIETNIIQLKFTKFTKHTTKFLLDFH